MADFEAHHAQSSAARQLAARVSAERWQLLVVRAQARAATYQAVMAAYSGGASMRRAIAEAGDGVDRSTLLRWHLAVQRGEGPLWERLLDRRVPPPPPPPVPQPIRQAAVQLRRTDVTITCERARKTLETLYGAQGNVSNATLRRLWRADRASPSDQLATADLRLMATAGAHATAPAAATAGIDGRFEVLSCGAGLALLAAADAELGASLQMARGIQQFGHERVGKGGGEQRDPTAGRDDQGRFTAVYNGQWRQGIAEGDADARWHSDAAKVGSHGLGGLRVLQVSEAVLADKLLAMGVTPLLTERRGFDGLAAWSGAALAALGGTAYMPATLDKCLAELGLLDADEAMWPVHARLWHEQCVRWRGASCGADDAWLQTAVYVDGSADPYWTRAFAKSGPVSRVGRVMPCVTRIAVHSGAGVPLLVETHMGAVSLRERLLPMLGALDAAIGPQAGVCRLTVVDSEVGSGAMLMALHEQTEAIFIVPVKGSPLRGATVVSHGAWQPYRDRDRIREVEFALATKSAPAGMPFRGVQMQRQGGRNPKTTLLATNAAQDEMPAAQVASEYLARWPRQEQQFRLGRDGGGMERSHGFGGGQVEHVAVVKKRAKAARARDNAAARLDKAKRDRQAMTEALRNATPAQRKAALGLANARIRSLEQRARRCAQADSSATRLPDEIHLRDGGRDSVATCCKLMAMALLEFVLREYFGGVAMQWRTFIEELVALPVAMLQTGDTCLYRVTANPRQPQEMARLEAALAEINRRQIVRGGRLLEFQLVAAVERGS